MGLGQSAHRAMGGCLVRPLGQRAREEQHGVLVARGGAFGGWSLYLHDGKPAYCYNLFGMTRFDLEGPT